MKNYQLLFLTLLTLLILPETTVAFFFSKNLDAKEFAALINDLPEGAISERQIKRVAPINLITHRLNSCVREQLGIADVW